MIARLGDEMGAVEVEGDQAWMLAADLPNVAASSPSGSVRLVPAFDPYAVAATRHAARLMPGDFRGRVYRQQGWLSPVLLVGGRMEGVWRHERRGKRLMVEIEPFGKQPRWVTELAAEEAEAPRLVPRRSAGADHAAVRPAAQPSARRSTRARRPPARERPTGTISTPGAS